MRLRHLFIHTASFLVILTGLSFSANASAIENVFGFGIGLPYGGVGVNYELGLNDYFAATAGVGALPDNVGWNAGVRFYYPGRNYKFRGRLTALYGTNTVLEREGYYETEYDTETGFSGGIGFNWRFARNWAFDGDLFFADDNVPDGYERKNDGLVVSLGFSVRW